MTRSFQFGRRSTADQVLAGVDLSGKRILVTGCNSGLGLETMNALAANGAAVIGLGRTQDAAAAACAGVSPNCIPIACDLSQPESIAAALASISELSLPLDAIIANAGVAALPALTLRHGVEMQFLVNYLGHFALVNGLAEQLRDRTGRIVIVSGSLRRQPSPDTIMFDNLDGHRFYDPRAFHAQSKTACALYAKELSRRLKGRGIAVNSVNPGAARTRINRNLFSRWLAKSPAQAAATQAMLAASPLVAGITGEHWENCDVYRDGTVLNDLVLAKRLWEASQELLRRPSANGGHSLQQAA